MNGFERLSLSGKVAIVTGAAMGMGEATAMLLAARGATVMVADRDAAKGPAVSDRIAEHGGRSSFVHVDVANESDVEAMVAETLDRFDRLDLAVNNAAVTPDTRAVPEADMDEVDRVLAVDLRGVLLCMKHEIAAIMRGTGGGSIVNIGSISSVRPQPANAGYVAAKHGVIGLTKTAALESGANNIRVNAVLPGAIDTPMLRGVMVENGLKDEDIAPGYSVFNRFGTPSEVAEATAWLLSDAASYVTGHALAVDGGYLSR